MDDANFCLKCGMPRLKDPVSPSATPPSHLAPPYPTKLLPDASSTTELPTAPAPTLDESSAYPQSRYQLPTLPALPLESLYAPPALSLAAITQSLDSTMNHLHRALGPPGALGPDPGELRAGTPLDGSEDGLSSVGLDALHHDTLEEA